MTTETLPLDSNGHLVTRRNNKVRVHMIEGHEPLILEVAAHCGRCDEKVDLTVEDGTVKAATACRYADGITTVITLAVPSGKMVVRDDLRPVYDWDMDSDTFASYNSTLGQAQAIEAMAAVGCAYGPVGNSCPGLYRTGEGTFAIASPGYDDNDEPGIPETDLLASICTDVWAYSIADHDDWLSRGGNPCKQPVTVVEVPPGTYRFTHHTGEADFEPNKRPAIFAHIARIA